MISGHDGHISLSTNVGGKMPRINLGCNGLDGRVNIQVNAGGYAYNMMRVVWCTRSKWSMYIQWSITLCIRTKWYLMVAK